MARGRTRSNGESTAPPAASYAVDADHWPLTVLDVGAGPISNVGTMTRRGKIALRACDALADLYTPVLQALAITPYVATEFALVERLTDVYAEESFDVITIENALDHAFDPFIGIEEMLRVCKTGGTVVLYHAENEAERECYNGFHQWNISERGSRLVIWRGEVSYAIGDVFADYAVVSSQREQVGDVPMIRASLQKTAHPPRRALPLMNTFDAILLRASRNQHAAPVADAAELLSTRDRNEQLQRTVAGLRGENEHLQRALAALRNSGSWRVTAPLRALADLSKRVVPAPRR